MQDKPKKKDKMMPKGKKIIKPDTATVKVTVMGKKPKSKSK